jgi:EAL domain-containing protein (putative c-di-GMP-specific phosphodiesterase class I)
MAGQSFVTTLASGESDAIMVRSTVNLAHDLGFEVVAEGIEDRATLDALNQMGCDYAQGYFISKPIAPDEFIQLVSQTAATRRVA